ncbi:MAG TPA: hypothetical protein EYP56_17750 [Planctomycetaceae bacterium]|nr:hypothetical protein [Planctomycetaceae bacterium]HIQ19962.1 hypothetical protein [Planctomycetota bacterium]
MSVGPMGGLPASAAGSPLAQTRSSDVERTQQEHLSTERRIQSDQKAQNASGIGETDGEDHQATERDADGRRLWEESPRRERGPEAEPQEEVPPQSRDASGQRGNLLDLSG